MAELLFILVTLYAAYVVHSVVTGNQKEKEELKDQPIQVSQKEIVVEKEEIKVVAQSSQKPVTKKVVASKAKVAPKAKPKVAVKAKPKATAKAKPKAATKTKQKTKVKAESQVPTGSVRNPGTGEVVKLASSYRMTKRWIKEALVAEGLLEKVYKISEIDEAATIKINKALDKFKVMDKYL